MVNEDQLEILRQGAVAWNKWRTENPYDVDLSKAILSGANLSGANLSGAQLFGISLSKANLSRVTLSGTCFSRLNWDEFDHLWYETQKIHSVLDDYYGNSPFYFKAREEYNLEEDLEDLFYCNANHMEAARSDAISIELDAFNDLKERLSELHQFLETLKKIW